MKAEMKLGAVLLAAGRSERFGGNKLLACYQGRPMICSALEAVRALPAEKICVVTGNDQIAALGDTYGCCIVWNDAPHFGQAHSICLGVSALREMDAVLLMAGDQPRLTAESLIRLLEAFIASPKGIACLCDETHRGNPAVFSKAYFSELLALSGDRGAKGILRAHEDDLIVIPCAFGNELADADTPQALADMQ